MVSIPDFLNFLGCAPTNRKGEWLHYHSPFREDKHPSFWVNLRTGTCGDLAEGRIGDVVNLAARYYNCDNATAAANIADSFRLGAFSSANKHTAAKPTIPTAKDTTIHIKHIQPLQNAALLQYVQERKITTETAKRYLQEVYYKTTDNETARQYFALAFKNDKGGYELRSKYFKGATANKTITTIRQNSDTVVVFEGFMDFLSCIEYWKCHNKTMPYDVIVLNSLVFAAKTDLSEYAHIKLLLDNDTAGQRAAHDITTRYHNTTNLTPRLLDGYKDFNEFWVKKYANLPK